MADLAMAPAPRARPVFRLRGNAYKAALVLHVLASVGWFGVAVTAVFCWITAKVTTDQDFSHALYILIARLPWLSVPAGLAATATGALLGLGTRYGLVRYWWVAAKILIAVAVLIADGTLTSTLAHSAAVRHASRPELYGSATAHAVVLVLATMLSVFKPSGRTPWGRARA